MGRAGPTVLRQQLLLWAGVVAVALSVLAMHQMSLNHTAAQPTSGQTVGPIAGPTAGPTAAHAATGVTDSAVTSSAATNSVEMAVSVLAMRVGSDAGHVRLSGDEAGGPANDTHNHVMPAGLDHQPLSGDGACPGCAEHHVMALTCLAAVILLATGWALRRPAAWRGIRLPRLLTRPTEPSPQWRPAPFTLVELSISRT